MNRILPFILFAASLWAFVGVVRPQYGKIQETDVLIEERRKTLQDVERVTELRRQRLEEQAAIPEEQVARLNKILPEELDVVRLALDISTLANAYQLSVRSIAADDPAEVIEQRKLSVDPSQPKPPPYIPIKFKVSLSGPYASYTAFLRDIERSLQLLDLDGMTLATETSGDADYNYEANLVTYQYVQ